MKQILYILLLLPLTLPAQSTDQNYILARTYLEKDGSKYNDRIQYFDGLGRPVQTVQKAITQGGKDLVNFTEYDGWGNERKNWLPAPSLGNTGAYISLLDFTALANNQYSTGEQPYSTTEFEPSPLNKVTGQYGAGKAWYDAGKKVTTEYGTNTNVGVDVVAHFYVNGSAQLQRDGNNHAANTLFKTTVTDEDGKSIIEYKDKLGRVVMKRSSTDVDTYYVYNDLGQLAYVLPPNFVDGMGGTTSFSDDNTLLKQFGYLYQYDDRGNCKYKRLPGCEPIYMVYDRADRLVLLQDGNQRGNAQWTVTKYDALGRIIFTGTTGAIPNSTALGDLILANKDKLIIESYSNGSGYTCTNFCDAAPLIINYYDSYNFTTFVANGSSFNWGTPPSGFDGQYLDSNGQPNAKGLLTGTVVYRLNDPTKYETTALYYDDRGRVVQTRATNHLGGYDISYNALDFLGKPTKTYKTHGINGASATITELYTYTYNKAQQPTITTYSLNGGGAVTLASNTYDELGRLITKKRHTNADTEGYAYNVRSWVTNITSGGFAENLYYNTNLPSGATANYNGNIAYSTWTYNGANKGYTYTYDNLNRLTLASFKQGSSSQVDGSFNEQFTFDKQGNISALQRKKDNTLMDNLVITPNGNQIASVIDNAGSQNQYSTKEYNNKASSNEFTYDANGNMKKDLDRNIVAIQYNILNLPDVVQFKNGNQIKNTYNAGGQKLGTEYYTQLTNITPLADGQIISQSYNPGTVDQIGNTYIGNVEYTTQNGNSSLTSLSRIYNEEGYVENISNPNYYYYRKDHLGNNREVWLANTGETVQRTQYYPSGLPWASNSGDNPGKQQRKYNGKEFVEMHGYDTYDYGARGYYPALPILPTVDPLAEKYYSISPYSYCGGNPVNRIDPDGMDWTITSEIDNEGVSHYHILFTGAVVDKTSDQTGQADKLAATITSQFEALFNQDKSNDVGGSFTVDAKAMIRSVDSEGDITKNETVFKIVDSNSKDLEYTGKDGEVHYAAGQELNGKEIAINKNAVPSMISGKNKKTISHEIGHLGGLHHPEDDNNFFSGLLGKPGYGMNRSGNNFMFAGGKPNDPLNMNPKGVTKRQLTYMLKLYNNGKLNRKDTNPLNE